jgi:transposase
MEATKEKSNRIIGLDMHPDVFCAAALNRGSADTAEVLWVQDRIKTKNIRNWAGKHLRQGDTLVLEASGNSFEITSILHELGFTALVLESIQAGKLRENYCNNDRSSAIKLARIYMSGLAKIVWQPDERTREYREVFFTHRNAVRDTTRARNRIRGFLNQSCVRLPKGTALTKPSALKKVLSLHPWSQTQKALITERFEQLWDAENRRNRMERLIVRILLENPKWAKLWRLMGVRHLTAFGIMAMIGDINRFPKPKKLVGYLGLAPGNVQSGNDAQGHGLGLGRKGRGDVRSLLIQSAQNALNQKQSPLHSWGWKLTLKKSRNIAAAAVARKLATAIWYLLKGHFTPMVELDNHLRTKLMKIATVLGKETLKSMGYKTRTEFAQKYYEKMQLYA